MLLFLVAFGVAGLLGSWMGGKRAGFGYMILTALVSGFVGLVVGLGAVMVLAASMGATSLVNGPELAFKALFLGIFFGGAAARRAQKAARI